MSKKAQNKRLLKSDLMSSIEGFTLPQILAGNAERFGAEGTAIREKAFGVWQLCSWKEYLEFVRRVCLGLLSIGFQRGENIALIIDNRPEWLFFELGAQAAGAVTVNLFTSTMSRELVYDLNHVNASFVFVENRRQVDKILAHREALPHVRRVIFVDPTDMIVFQDETLLLSFSQLLELGKGAEKEEPERFNRELWRGKPEDTAMMIMTSGTKGIPKPAMVSFNNLMAMARNWLENVPIGIDDNWVSLSPCAGIIEETWCTVIALAGGMTINFPETYDTRMNDMREIGPSVIVNYPGFWERLMSLVKTDLECAGPLRRWLYKGSFDIHRTIYDLKSGGKAVPLQLKFLQIFFRRIITIPLLDRLGLLGARHAYSGGYPISPEVIRFFRSNGLALKQCYGLAETSGIFQFQGDDDMSTDTVGAPSPGTGVRITSVKEITVSGKFTFSGYYHDPKATSDVLKEGRLYTGDIGGIDADGKLFIIGRKEDIIGAEDGRIFSRDFIETRIKESPFIKEAVIWGKGKPYLIAFIGIDFENAMAWAQMHDIAFREYGELTRHPVIEELIRNKIHDLNVRLPDKLRVRKFILINKELDTDEELTKTGIARRKFLFEQYRDILEAMYTDRSEAALIGRLRGVNDEIRTIKTRIRIISVPEGER
jgi:long-chain acyl-CoA synthetase